MNAPRFAPAVFMVVFCVAYIGVFAADWPLFRYYPQHGDWAWGWHRLAGAGVAMAWYGLMASAGVVALAAALLVPDASVLRWMGNRLWLFPVAAMAACVLLLRQFFA